MNKRLNSSEHSGCEINALNSWTKFRLECDFIQRWPSVEEIIRTPLTLSHLTKVAKCIKINCSEILFFIIEAPINCVIQNLLRLNTVTRNYRPVRTNSQSLPLLRTGRYVSGPNPTLKVLKINRDIGNFFRNVYDVN